MQRITCCLLHGFATHGGAWKGFFIRAQVDQYIFKEWLLHRLMA